MSNKTIVVFYMHGGHDGLNMLVPLDSYDRYASYRGNLAHHADSLIPLGTGQGRLAIHGNFSKMANLIMSGKAAPILGTGNLFEPTRRSQYDAKSVKLPQFLFSHSHQQSYNKGAYNQNSGWAGRILDTWYSGLPAPSLSPAITTTGDRDLVSAESLNVFQVDSQHNQWNGVTAGKQESVITLANNEDYNHVLARVARHIMGEAINSQRYIQDLFGQFQESGKLTEAATIASKLVALADQLGHERQIIHVSAPGGWDTHYDQFDALNEQYSVLDNLFTDFIDELAMYGVADNVVCVTASDFGRSLMPNNRGTDHGWGSNHLVWGNPVIGAQAIGDFIDYDDPDQWTRSKRMIPTLADVQTYATLGRWFGLSDSEIDSIFPTLQSFSHRDLGFLNM